MSSDFESLDSHGNERIMQVVGLANHCGAYDDCRDVNCICYFYYCFRLLKKYIFYFKLILLYFEII